MYQALYRKYRPSRFSDVVGQEHITTTLKNELKSGKIFHAYLFTGPRGTGKTSCAKILSKAVNCLSPVDGDACNECEICKAVDSGEVLDITEIDAASNNGVDYIRELKEQVCYTPVTTKYRVYIIDEVHMLSQGAFNAMLKILEEPPSHIIFILATTEVHKIPATILSRCQRFDFHRIDNDRMRDRIMQVASMEGIEIEQKAADLIAALSDGGMRDALSTLDLCAAHTKNITEKDVEQVCAISGREYCDEFSSAVLSENTAKALEVIGRLHSNSIDMQRLCNELIAFYRDLMVIKSVQNAKELVVCSSSELEKLQKRAEQYSIERVMYCMTVLSNALNKMNNSNRKAEMEMAAVKLCNTSLSDTNEALLARLEKLERTVKMGVVVTPLTVDETADEVETLQDAEISEPEVVEESKPTAKTVETKGAVEEFGLWGEVLAELEIKDPPMFGVLNNSRAFVKGDYLLIDCKNEMFKALVNQNMHRESIRNAVKFLTGRLFKLGPYKKEEIQETEDPLLKIASVLGQL